MANTARTDHHPSRKLSPGRSRVRHGAQHGHPCARQPARRRRGETFPAWHRRLRLPPCSPRRMSRGGLQRQPRPSVPGSRAGGSRGRLRGGRVGGCPSSPRGAAARGEDAGGFLQLSVPLAAARARGALPWPLACQPQELVTRGDFVPSPFQVELSAPATCPPTPVSRGGPPRPAHAARWRSSRRNPLLKETLFFPLSEEIRGGWAAPKRIYKLNFGEFVGIAVAHRATLAPSFYGSEMDSPHRVWRLRGERSSSLQLSSGRPSPRALLRR